MVLACENSCLRKLFEGVYIKLPKESYGDRKKIGNFKIITAVSGMVLIIK
jgi:hypothetical protein